MSYIAEAYKYNGKHERTDNAELKKLLKMDPAAIAWCAYFVSAILNKCGAKIPVKALARAFLVEGYGQPLSRAMPGDVVVFKRGKLPWQGHVGFFVRKNKTHVTVLGGNQDNRVCEKDYPIDSILGIRRI